MFTVGATYKEAATAREVWQDAMTITVLAKAYGGVRHMAPAMVDFIVNWEVESYRAKVSLAAGAQKKLNGKIAIVIDGAQINVGEFKVNGGAMISINQATTVQLSDTEVNVGLNRTYTSYFISQENKATISGCEFNVLGTDGANYTVSETGKQWVAAN
jgi:hypothetical protein